MSFRDFETRQKAFDRRFRILWWFNMMISFGGFVVVALIAYQVIAHPGEIWAEILSGIRDVSSAVRGE